MGYIRNAVLIHAPLEDVFRLTNNVRNWPILFTEYEACEVLEEGAHKVTFRLTTRPNEHGQQWNWVSSRWTDQERHSTYSERQVQSLPFERMTIRWWYDAIAEQSTVMTWEQEFAMYVDASISEQQATDYLNAQTRTQQLVIKDRVEGLYHKERRRQYVEPADGFSSTNASDAGAVYRGVIVGRYRPGDEEAIAKAFRRSDATELPHLLGVSSRHVWVLGDIYIHFVESPFALSAIIKDYASHPLFKEIKGELDAYVTPLAPDLLPGVAKEIYRWTPRSTPEHVTVSL